MKQRLFKFRAWDNGEMHYLGFNTLGVNYNHPSGVLYFREEMRPFGKTHVTIVMQFTGLTDARREDIYEGDIVETTYSKYKGFAYECIYCEESGMYLFKPFMVGNKDAPLLGIETFAKPWDEVEGVVVGNIYENPELLKS